MKPELPKNITFPARTQEWFSKLRESSLSDNWTALEWEFAFDTALVHSLIWTSKNFMLLNELRKREEKMGMFEKSEASSLFENSPLANIIKNSKINVNAKASRKPKANV